MTASVMGVRLEVVHRLQKRATQYQVRGYVPLFVSDSVDLAIDYAMSDRRNASSVGFLQRNATRDARHAVQRTSARSVSLDAACVDEDGNLASSSATPEELLIVKEEAEALLASAAALDPADGPTALRAMLDGESIAEASVSSGASERRVKYLRGKLRHAARGLAVGGAR